MKEYVKSSQTWPSMVTRRNERDGRICKIISSFDSTRLPSRLELPEYFPVIPDLSVGEIEFRVLSETDSQA
uniref:Uncharacterized protein n=1 Tax=Arion vulgaris TaxID=1028688 RepID=A0A0B7BE96_9EUPU